MVYRDLTPDEIEKTKKESLVEEGEDCIDEMLKRINKHKMEKGSKNSQN